MTNNLPASWLKIKWWVTFYSYITFFAVFYGIAAAHVPFIIGHPWTSCEINGCGLCCVLVFHMYEVPLVLFNAYIAWYGLKKFSKVTITNFMSLINFAVAANFAFFTFETILLQDSIKREAPCWESIALTSVALILCGGSFLGIYVKQKLIEYNNKSMEK